MDTMNDDSGNASDGLDEQFRKLFQEPDEIEKQYEEIVRKTNLQQKGHFSECTGRHGNLKIVSPFDQNTRNVGQKWRSTPNDHGSRTIHPGTQPTSKYMQQIEKRSTNVKQSWRSSRTDRRYSSGYAPNSAVASTRPSTLGQGRSPRRQLGANTTFKSDRSVRNRAANRNLKILLQISYLEAEQVCQTLSDGKFAFLDVLEHGPSLNELVLLLRIMNKLWRSTFDEFKVKMLTQACYMEILEKIKKHIITLPTQDAADKIANEYFWNKPEAFWTHLHRFYENVFHFMPQTACELLPKMLKTTLIVMNDAEQQHSELNICSEFTEKFEDCQRSVSDFMEQEEAKAHGNGQGPPDDFRWMSPYPSEKEITTRDPPFIRPIIARGAYQSVHHYLDVQYRLLREDFVASLRNGICSHLERGYTDTNERQYDVRIYENVQFLKPLICRNRVAQLVQYGSKEKPRANVDTSKYFLYGSLVCFTQDNFNTVTFGTVTDNNTKCVQKGQLIVNMNDTVLYNCTYLMVECSVFFEPYYHVLQSFKKIDENAFPFKKYIVDVSCDTDHPQYMTHLTTVYHWNKTFRILSPETWPSAEQMGLNVSQHRAFQSALMREFCIIQGPPGTGKTYTSLKIAEFLLANRDILQYAGPILVVCFTNHALDQFLEGLLPFTKKLLRIGGRSKSKILEEYNLTYYKKFARKFSVKVVKHHLEEEEDGMDEFESVYDDMLFKEYAYLDLMEYNYKLRMINSQYKEVCVNLKPVFVHMRLIELIFENDGILEFHHFKKIDRNIENSWFGNAQRADIVEWLMEGVDENIQESENVSNLYLNAEQLDSLNGKVSNGTYLNSLFEYRTKISELNLEIMKLNDKDNDQKLNHEDNDRKLLHLTRQIRTLEHNVKYLKWRLNQFSVTDTIAEPQPVDYNNPRLLTPDERWNLYRYWLKTLYVRVCSEVPYMICGDAQYDKYQKAIDSSTLHIMERMHVIGMTTTGAAKCYDILQQLKCPIVIVEEAAEVLEAHVVTSLTEACQHLILIGDHKQLRPNTAQYNLAKKYNLEISLFERMVCNEVHCQQLDVQHRMRPEISRLIVPAIYSKLDNAASVHKYPPVLGVTSSVFFVTHAQYEDTMHDSSSHKNVYEAMYLLNLARYLRQQGYTAGEITILATYAAQVSCLLHERTNNYEDLSAITITGVDNFQGEESKIVLLSLVRSNASANIGFLKTENRVCVALSRAREGLYIIGNMNNLEASSTIWAQIRQALEEQDSIGPVLELQCQNHGTLTTIKTPRDFQNVPDGGCHLPCDFALPCGHACRWRCHNDDPKHTRYYCAEKCETVCPRNHACSNPCGEDCEPCQVPIEMVFLCGHKNVAPCSTELLAYECPTLVTAELRCGHSLTIPCHTDPNAAQCIDLCGKTMHCGHTCTGVCHMGTDDDHVQYRCEEPCTKFKKDCSVQKHKCDLRCHEPCEPCDEQVKKRRTTCSHTITVPCTANADDTLCREKCRKMLACGHHCPLKCFESCGGCRVQVTKVNVMCGHSLKVACHQAPGRQSCTQQCPLKLKCGHVCKNKCNEPCTVNCTEVVRYVNGATGEEHRDVCYAKPVGCFSALEL